MVKLGLGLKLLDTRIPLPAIHASAQKSGDTVALAVKTTGVIFPVCPMHKELDAKLNVVERLARAVEVTAAIAASVKLMLLNAGEFEAGR